MPRLVHLAPQSLARRIERSGLRGGPATVRLGASDVELSEAVYAMPVLPDYAATYQWLRELRRWKGERLIAVHFALPSTEPVYAGRFGQPKLHGHASAMIAEVRARPDGAELVVPRRIDRAELIDVRAVRQDVGWVGTPEPGPGLDCVCPVCLPSGTPHMKKRVRRAYEAAVAAARGAETPAALASALGTMDLPLERSAASLRVEPLLGFSSHPDAGVRKAAFGLLGYFRTERATARLVEALGDPEAGDAALESLIRACGVRATLSHVRTRAPHRIVEFIEHLAYSRAEEADALLRLLATSSEQGVAERASYVLAERA